MIDRSIGRPKNTLLASLSGGDFALLEAHLDPIDLALRFRLEDSNKPIEYAYFPEVGIASVVAKGAHKRELEVGLIGREGMSGINIVLGGDRSPHATYMQIAGHGLRIPAIQLRTAMRESASLQQSLLHYVQTFMLQTTHTALANGQAKVEERLARWLLMAHDRVGASELPLTHNLLAIMLSVRRPGVTLAVQVLENRNLIGAKRGTITVLNRAGLKALADGLYGVPEAEYKRFFG